MAKLWRKSANEDGTPDLQEVDLSSIAINRPTVIYLSGFLTTDKKTAAVTEGADAVEDFLQQAGNDLKVKPDVLVWSHTRLGNLFNIAAYNLKPQGTYSSNALKLARAVILPLVTTPDGKPLPTDVARARLRNLTFLGYSAGSVVAQETFNASMELMQQAGYEKKAARDILADVVLVSTGTMSSPSREGGRFTSVLLAGNNDVFIRWRRRIWKPLKSMFSFFSRKLSVDKISDRCVLVTAAIRRKFWHWRHKPDGSKEKRSIIPQLPSWTLLSTHHEFEHYVTNDEGHNPFARIALNAVVNAVNRQGPTDPMQLLAPLPSTPAEDKKAYREKFAKGLPRHVPLPPWAA